MYNIGLRSSRHQRNRYQEVYSHPHNNSAIIYTVCVPGIVTSSSNQNISLSILIATLRRTSNLFASLERCHLFKIQQPFLRNTT